MSTHPLSAGVVGSYSGVRQQDHWEADLVCFVGSKTGGMTTHFWQVPAPGIDAIQIDIEPAEIGRNYPLKAAVQGDAKTVLSAMAEMMDTETANIRTAWTTRMQTIASEWQTEYEPLLPRRCAHQARAHVP